MFLRKIVFVLAMSGFVAGCSSEPDPPAYGFGETDMQSVILGNWTGTISISGQAPTALTMNIVQVPSLQPACGSRTFNAPQCVETSSMNVEATVSTADKSFDSAKLQGEFLVIGLELNNGELSLSGNGVNISGGIDATKTIQDLSIYGSVMGTGTMQR